MKNKTSHKQLWRYCCWIHAPQPCPAYGKTCARCKKMGHFRKVCRSKRDHEVHEVEAKMVQDSLNEEIETVSSDSIHLNKNWLVITAHLETHAGENTKEVPYKIDMGSEGNIMPLYIFKKLLKNVKNLLYFCSSGKWPGAALDARCKIP